VKTKRRSLNLVEGRVQDDFYIEVMRHNQEDENQLKRLENTK
jgi:hypothetical protein